MKDGSDLVIYLDYAATTPMDEEAIDVYSQASRRFFGNASSLHDIGSDSARLLDMSRQQLADMLNIKKKASSSRAVVRKAICLQSIHLSLQNQLGKTI